RQPGHSILHFVAAASRNRSLAPVRRDRRMARQTRQSSARQKARVLPPRRPTAPSRRPPGRTLLGIRRPSPARQLRIPSPLRGGARGGAQQRRSPPRPRQPIPLHRHPLPQSRESRLSTGRPPPPPRRRPLAARS